jgi:eukaryotic-like serine/threonine-protein kinase
MSPPDEAAPPRTPGPPDVPSSPDPHDPLLGAVLAGRYEVRARVGEGGMGAVYEGRHTVLGKRVAIKVLLEKFHEKTDLVARLLQEARLASAIGHEHIVDVTDYGTTADGRSFVVMEYLEGESLAQAVMREAPLPVARCLRIARQVVSALGAAHDKGIVHRDVKPENVFLLRRGEQDFVKVMDFGVSKAVRSRDEGGELLRLTRTGMVLGTPLYMSPEQARGGEDVDGRADIWAVGVMLYECLTGEVPFRANNYLGVISQVLTQAVEPPSSLRPELGIPEAVEKVVMRAMEKDREKRYQRMAELESDLDRLLAGDQNVGLQVSETVAGSAGQGAPRAGAARWHLGIAAVMAVGLGLALALARTEEDKGRASDEQPAGARVQASTPRPGAPRAVQQPPPAPGAARAAHVPAAFTGDSSFSDPASKASAPVEKELPARRRAGGAAARARRAAMGEPPSKDPATTERPRRPAIEYTGGDHVLPTEKVYRRRDETLPEENPPAP